LLSNQLSDFDLPQNYSEFSEVFNREHKKVIDVVNTKEGGVYSLQEQSTFQKYYNENDPQSTRNVYRKVFSFGRLPNSGTKRLAHDISVDTNFRLTRLYGASSDLTNLKFISIPFSSSTLNENVSLEIDQEDVIITTGSDRSSFTETSIVMEYTKG
jgi:hypothetical protein